MDIKDFAKINNITVGEISDEYHTFDELYDHRSILYLSLLSKMQAELFSIFNTKHSGQKYKIVWSDTHHDGEKWDGWLIVSCMKVENGEQISYHISDKYKYLIESQFEFVDKAPEWDGHTSEDVLNRLVKWTFDYIRIK